MSVNQLSIFSQQTLYYKTFLPTDPQTSKHHQKQIIPLCTHLRVTFPPRGFWPEMEKCLQDFWLNSFHWEDFISSVQRWKSVLTRCGWTNHLIWSVKKDILEWWMRAPPLFVAMSHFFFILSTTRDRLFRTLFEIYCLIKEKQTFVKKNTMGRNFRICVYMEFKNWFA